MHSIKSLKDVLLIQSALYKIVKLLVLLLEVPRIKSLRDALLIQSVLYKIVKKRVLLLKLHSLKSLKDALLKQSALSKNCKNEFFTKNELNKIIKICASYSKRTVQNCKGTRSLIKVHSIKILKNTLFVQCALYKNEKKRSFTKS